MIDGQFQVSIASFFLREENAFPLLYLPRASVTCGCCVSRSSLAVSLDMKIFIEDPYQSHINKKLFVVDFDSKMNAMRLHEKNNDRRSVHYWVGSQEVYKTGIPGTTVI